MLFFSQTSLSSDTSWLAGIYLDNLNKANIKGGITFNDDYEYNEDNPHYYGSFKYSDIEIGLEGYKLSVGVGQNIGHGLDRIGLSYAWLDTQDLAGVEAIISQMGMSIKIGCYFGLDNTSDKFLIGVGLGF